MPSKSITKGEHRHFSLSTYYPECTSHQPLEIFKSESSMYALVMFTFGSNPRNHLVFKCFALLICSAIGI